MTYRNASKLHNGDEVIDKQNGESIKVLHILKNLSYIVIVGLGNISGHHHWHHTAVK